MCLTSNTSLFFLFISAALLEIPRWFDQTELPAASIQHLCWQAFPRAKKKKKCTSKKWSKNLCQGRASAGEAHWRLNEMKPSLTGPKFYRGENTSCSEPSHSSGDSMSNCLNPVVDESLDSPAATAAPTQSRDRFTLANKHSVPEQVTKCCRLQRRTK